jgi:hypothetical protein
MGRTRNYVPLPREHEPDEQLLAHVAELQRLRAENAELHREVETLRQVLRTIFMVARPYGADRQQSNGPVRPHSRVSRSGEPIYDD